MFGPTHFFVGAAIALITHRPQALPLLIAVTIVVPYFTLGYASHLVIDLLNKKCEKLIWPMKKGFSLNICSSRGLINELMMSAGIFVSAIYVSTLPSVQVIYGAILNVLHL